MDFETEHDFLEYLRPWVMDVVEAKAAVWQAINGSHADYCQAASVADSAAERLLNETRRHIDGSFSWSVEDDAGRGYDFHIKTRDNFVAVAARVTFRRPTFVED